MPSKIYFVFIPSDGKKWGCNILKEFHLANIYCHCWPPNSSNQRLPGIYSRVKCNPL